MLVWPSMQVPNGELSAKQLRWLGNAMANDCGDIACGDITTRANIQLRGMTLETSDKIFDVRSLPSLWPVLSLRRATACSQLP